MNIHRSISCVQDKIMEEKIENFILNLYKYGGITIELCESDERFPIFIDIERCMRFFEVLESFSDIFIDYLKRDEELDCIDAFCGIPINTLHLSSVLACKAKKNCIIPIKKSETSESKVTYEQGFNGYFHGGIVYLIADVITSGNTEKKLAQELSNEFDCEVKILCFLAKKDLHNIYPEIDYIINIRTLLEILEKNRVIETEKVYKIYRHFFPLGDILQLSNTLSKSSSIRNISRFKKSKVIIELNDEKWEDIVPRIHHLGGNVLGFKICGDTFSSSEYEELSKLSLSYNFIILRETSSKCKTEPASGVIDIIDESHDFLELDPECSYIINLERKVYNILSKPEYRSKILDSTYYLNGVIGYISHHMWWVGSPYRCGYKFCFTSIDKFEDLSKVEDMIIIKDLVLKHQEPLEMLVKINGILEK